MIVQNVFAFTGNVTVQNTTTETNLINQSHAAGKVRENNGIRVTIVGQYTNNSGSAQQIDLRGYYGGSLFSTLTFPSIPTNGTLRGCLLVYHLTNVDSLTARVIYAQLQVLEPNDAGANVAIYGTTGSYDTNSSVNSADAQAIRVSCQHGSAASTILFAMRSCVVEVV